MKQIHVQAIPFFELLKSKEQSMWQMFAQLIKDEEQELIFLDEDNKVLFNFILPKTTEELLKKQAEFTEAFKQKLQQI